MIRLRYLLFENKEQTALEYIRKLIDHSPFKGKVYLAGGAVRDEVMGKPVKDLDVVVAMPDGGIAFADWLTKRIGAYREGSNPVIYPRFGTAKFNLRGASFDGIDLSDIDIESVMTRGEKYTQGSRKPEVIYSDLKTDVLRRDLTVNTLLKDISSGEILDLTGHGISDIKKGIVRTPLNPDITFKDDPLRMLRAVRFAVKYNWKMPLSMVKALKKNSEMLKTISAERIQDELNKILMTDNPDKGLKILSFTGLNRFIIPELDKCRNVEQNKHHDMDVFDHICEVVKNTPPNLKARLSALFHDIGKVDTKTSDETGIHFYGHEDAGAIIAEERMKKLRYSNDMIHSVTNIVQNHMRLKSAGPEGTDISDKAIRKFVNTMGPDLEPALDMMQGDNLSHNETSKMPNQIKRIRDRIKNTQAVPTKIKLPINGNDIMKTLGVKPGPMIKQLLGTVEDAYYDNPSLDKDSALNLVKKEYEKLSGGRTQSDMMHQKIKNPETGNDILIKTALDYDKEHPAHKAAVRKLKSR